jgi:hypothetical protein
MSTTTHRTAIAALAACALIGAGCGSSYVRDQGRGPTQATVSLLEGAPGAEPDKFGTTLASDVLTNVRKTIGGVQTIIPTIFSDNGRVTMSLMLKDPGLPGAPTSPTAVNDVTFTRYRVVYTRTDGRNTPGVDVPYPFDSAVTFTTSANATSTAGFDLVRVAAKEEAPLRALVTNPQFISVIAEVTFYGKDRVGNDVSASGSIGITFGNFGDPD